MQLSSASDPSRAEIMKWEELSLLLSSTMGNRNSFYRLKDID